MSTDYSKMNDQEINMAIAEVIFPDYKVIESKSRPPSACVISHLPSKLVDYCNNPADAWPIISDNRISIMFDQSTEKGSEAQWCLASSPCDQHVVDYISSSKLLRAAMIVFLKMQESKNAS